MPDFAQDIRDHKFWVCGTPDAPLGCALIYAVSPIPTCYVVCEAEVENPAYHARYLSEKYSIPIDKVLDTELAFGLNMNFYPLYLPSDLKNAVQHYIEREQDIINLGQLDGSKSLRLYADDYRKMYVEHVMENVNFYWMLDDNWRELARRLEQL